MAAERTPPDAPPDVDEPEASSGEEASGPPGRAGRRRSDETLRTGELPESVRCPHCGEEESEQFAAFGSSLSVSQYYCRSCRTVFEFFKWR